ncbi:MAG: hypothetical protein PF692_09745, partial [Kiritimatiellae bacterium]|nr:hypothetical protein [Kiritimatiellia bacterium]
FKSSKIVQVYILFCLRSERWADITRCCLGKNGFPNSETKRIYNRKIKAKNYGHKIKLENIVNMWIIL